MNVKNDFKELSEAIDAISFYMATWKKKKRQCTKTCTNRSHDKTSSNNKRRRGRQRKVPAQLTKITMVQDPSILEQGRV